MPDKQSENQVDGRYDQAAGTCWLQSSPTR